MDIQTDNSFLRDSSCEKASPTINLVEESQNINNTENQNISVQQCFHILFNTLTNKLKSRKKELFQVVLLFTTLIFGIETSLILGLINLIYLLYQEDIPVEVNHTTLDTSTVKEVYDDLKVPKTHEVQFARIKKKFAQRRKKKEFRDTSDSDNESEGEEEVYLAPNVPSSVPYSAKFHVTGTVDSQEIRFQVDTGSAISIINKTVFENIPKSHILGTRPPQRSYTDFNGSCINFLTEVILQVCFKDIIIKQNFLVAESPTATNLLGVDCIRSKRISMEISDENHVFLTFKNKEKQIKQRISIDENTEYTLLVKETTPISPNGTTKVEALLEDCQINFVNRGELHNVIGITRSTLDPFRNDSFLSALDSDGSLTVPIYNKDFGESMIFAGQTLGTFKPLAKETEIYNRRDNTVEVIGNDFKVKPNLNNTIKKLDKELKKRQDKSRNKEPSVNKIKLTNTKEDSSEAGNESDFVEDMLPSRIPDSPKVWEELLQDVPPHFRKRVFHCLTVKHPKIVSKGPSDFGLCTLADSEFKIDLTDNQPITTKPYSLNRVYEAQLREVIDDMVDNKLLTPESSSYSSGVFIRPRPDASNTNNFRIRCITDFRQLNAKTVQDLYPLPSMKMLLQKLNGMKHFILLDLKDSYYSIPIKKSDRYKASILTSFGQFTPDRMSYGFSNAANWFSRQIARVIEGLPGCSHYMDDCIIYGRTQEETLDNFERVVAALEKAGFRISLGKLKIFKSFLKLLGVVISSNGILPDPSKVESICSFPPPKTKKQLMRFLGMANFLSDFCANYSLIAGPLYKLTAGPDSNINLNAKELEAFEKLKASISKPTMLSFMDPAKPVYLETDAANGGYGGVAYQIDVFKPSDLPNLQLAQEEISKKTEEGLDEEMKKLIETYTNGTEIPPYSPFETPSMSCQTQEELFNPYLTNQLKIVKKQNKLFVPRVIFFISCKFSDVQQKSWSSLMKELSAIVESVEKRADWLSLAKETIVLSDCQACCYLYHQAKSNSLMSRYLARLSCYPFKIMVRHKSGEKL